MATTYGQAAAPISASAVISKQPGSILQGILLNSVAATATIQLYDGALITDLTTPITGLWTPGAITVPTLISIGLTLNKGLVIIIAVAAANLTAIGRFSQ